MIGLVNMPSIVQPVMNSPRRKKKTRRGKKQIFNWREMIPPSAVLSVPVESQRVSSCSTPVTCGCGTTSTDMNTGHLPTFPRKKNVKSKPYLRPTPPKAPLNSTQFIMEEGYHMEDPEFLSLYHTTDDPWVCGSPSPRSACSESRSSRKSSTTSNRESLDIDFLLSLDAHHQVLSSVPVR